MPIANIGSVPDVVTATVIASDWGNAIGSASRGRAVQRFNSPAERDASITAPVAGMVCYVLSTNQFYGYRAGAWAALSLGNVYKAALGRTPVQSVAAGSATVTLDTAVFDPAGMLNAGKLTVPVAGYWSVAYAATVASGASGPFQANLQRNGTVVALGSAQALNLGINVTSVGSALVQCAAGDVLSLNEYQGSAGAINVTGGVTANYLHAHLLSV